MPAAFWLQSVCKRCFCNRSGLVRSSWLVTSCRLFVINCGLVSPSMPEPPHVCTVLPCPMCGRTLSECTSGHSYGRYGDGGRGRGRDGGGGGGSSGAVIGMRSGKEKDLEGSTGSSTEDLGAGSSNVPSLSDVTESHDDSKHRENLPQASSVDLSVDSSAKTQALDGMEMGEEKYLKWKSGKSEHTLRLQRAWVLHSVWVSIENVCKVSSSVLVNKLQCKHIADHFKVIADVLKQLGLGKDLVSSQALEGGSGYQTNLTFDEMRFSRVAKNFEHHFFSMKKSDRQDFMVGSSHFRTQVQNVSNMFKDYVHELPALDGSSREPSSKKAETSEGFQECSRAIILGN